MMAPIAAPDTTALGYDCLAPFYDRFSEGYAHEPWVAAIERWAMRLGLGGSRALDLACGTGNSTLPLIARGYSVRACDISGEMIAEAQRKFPDHAEEFFVADIRALPVVGEFDLIVCLDDAINYLLSDTELESAFGGVARVLSPTGIFAFDVNSLLTYRTAFSETAISEAEGMLFAWRGEGQRDLRPGEMASASVEIFAEREDGVWERHQTRHVQRHHPRQAIYTALEAAGLRPCATLGQHRGAVLEERADEMQHIKLVHFAKRRDVDHCECGR